VREHIKPSQKNQERRFEVVRVEGITVYLKESEVQEAACPLDTKWAVSQIRMYGADANFKGRLASLSRCPRVLEDAGYQVKIEEEKTPETEY
jgi:hypothetical protein